MKEEKEREWRCEVILDLLPVKHKGVVGARPSTQLTQWMDNRWCKLQRGESCVLAGESTSDSVTLLTLLIFTALTSAMRSLIEAMLLSTSLARRPRAPSL
jgi:hypothetical protein